MSGKYRAGGKQAKRKSSDNARSKKKKSVITRNNIIEISKVTEQGVVTNKGNDNSFKVQPKNLKPRFYKQPSYVLAAIGWIIAIFFGLTSYQGDRKINDLTIENVLLSEETNRLSEETNRLSVESNKRLNDIDALLALFMQSYSNLQSVVLEKTFPNGYQLVAIRGNSIVLGPSENFDNVKIDWNTTRIIDVTDEKIILEIPSMILYEHIFFFENYLVISRGNFSALPLIDLASGLHFYGQILEDKGNTIIIAFGVK